MTFFRTQEIFEISDWIISIASRGLPKRHVTVSFVDADAFFVSICLMELHIPKYFANKEEFETSLHAAILCVGYNSW